ncbi:MAG: DNA replication and repair protein RecF, partial [Pseudomonadota bacterium]
RLSGMTPLLLLDEVAAHLDEIRRAALFDTLEDLGCQAFMTGTDLALFDQLTDRSARFEVNDGTVTKI